MNAAPSANQMRTAAVPTQDREAARAAKTVLDWLDRGAPRQSLPAPELRTLAALATDSGDHMGAQ
jgi:hypothetical protein